jgi:hypothetical protein
VSGQHTPGPWKAVVRSNQLGPRSAFVTDDKHKQRLFASDKPTATDIANARLIAAAPELLDALEALRNECSGTPRPNVMLALLANADLAIAKARGQ